ncbi:MAG: hypothetical protein ABI950_01650 [Solirubrobacteraceae bacterium]
MPRALLLAAALVAVAVTAYGVLTHLADATLGTALPPFVMSYGIRVEPLWLLAAAAAVAALTAAAPRLLTAALPAPAFAAIALAAALVLELTVNAVRLGTYGWWRIFDLRAGGSFEAGNEYLPGLGALRYGGRFFLDRFAELIPALPVNVAGHPPALMLVIDTLGLGTAQRLAGLCIACAAVTAPLAYALARTLGLQEPSARLAGLLAAASPAMVLFGATSADAVFAAVGLGAACLLASRRPPVRALGAVALAVAAFFSWALLAIAAWGAILAWRREGLRAAVILAVACAVAVVAFNALLYAVSGYDPIGTLRATEAYYRNSLARDRPYRFWVLGSPVAFLVTVGLPVAAGLLTGVRRALAPALAIGGVIAVAALAGFTKAEVERIWLPFVPLACVAAAAALPTRRPRVIVGALAAQALLTMVAFETIW